MSTNTPGNTRTKAAGRRTRIAWIHQGESPYPGALVRFLGERAPAALAAVGNLDVLQREMLAFFCSVKCTGNLILRTYDYAHELREQGVVVIGGFHSPVEQECLVVLLRGKQPVVVCPARSIETMRIPKAWRKPLEDGRLLLISQFEQKQRRMTVPLAECRNDLVAALADQVFVAHAARGGKTEQFCGKIHGWGKPLLTFDAPENVGLIAAGAVPIRPNVPG